MPASRRMGCAACSLWVPLPASFPAHSHFLGGDSMTEFILQHPFWIAAVLLVLTAACTAHYKLHPGALNTADSAAYDPLLIAEAAIDQARAENQTRPFSAEAKVTLLLPGLYNSGKQFRHPRQCANGVSEEWFKGRT